MFRGLGFRALGLGFRVQGLGFTVPLKGAWETIGTLKGLGFRVLDTSCVGYVGPP